MASQASNAGTSHSQEAAMSRLQKGVGVEVERERT